MAKIYQKSIYAGTKTIDEVPEKWLNAVKALFRADVESGKITKERYKELTHEDYDD